MPASTFGICEIFIVTQIIMFKDKFESLIVARWAIIIIFNPAGQNN